jgi:hypothetical protein
MSESQAYLRIQAARLGRQFPVIVELLAKGSLHLTAIKLVGPHLTPDNHVQVLARASGQGKREIELLVAELAPKPDVPGRMRKLPEASSGCVTQTVEVQAHASQALFASEVCVATQPRVDMPSVAAPVGASRATFALEAPRARASSTPLRPGRYKVELTAGQSLHDKLEQLQKLLRHQVPDGDLAVIVERAVDVLLDKTVRQRFAQTRAPRKPRAIKRSRKANSRYIPRAVIREVYQRDSGQCTFVSQDGKRCCERGFLEFHHHNVPFGRGGAATTDNVRLACRVHNALFAERDFGTGYMHIKLLHARARARASSGSGGAELCPERVQV